MSAQCQCQHLTARSRACVPTCAPPRTRMQPKTSRAPSDRAPQWDNTSPSTRPPACLTCSPTGMHRHRRPPGAPRHHDETHLETRATRGHRRADPSEDYPPTQDRQGYCRHPVPVTRPPGAPTSECRLSRLPCAGTTRKIAHPCFVAVSFFFSYLDDTSCVMCAEHTWLGWVTGPHAGSASDGPPTTSCDTP